MLAQINIRNTSLAEFFNCFECPDIDRFIGRKFKRKPPFVVGRFFKSPGDGMVTIRHGRLPENKRREIAQILIEDCQIKGVKLGAGHGKKIHFPKLYRKARQFFALLLE